MLLNLKRLREFDFFEQCVKYYDENKELIIAQDQDILNGVFDGKYLDLPLICNICTPLYHEITDLHKKLTPKQKKDIFENPGIVHFTYIYKPWIMSVKHPFKNNYWEYYSYTPFKADYYLYLLKKFFSGILYFEKYKRAKKYKTTDVYLFNFALLSYKKCLFKRETEFLKCIKYVRLKNKYKSCKYILLSNIKIKIK